MTKTINFPKSKIKGLTWNSTRNFWRARIFYNGQVQNIGVGTNQAMLACKLQRKVEALTKQGIYVNPGYGKPKRKIKKSAYKGISWNKPGEQWQARISVNGEQIPVSSE